MTQESAPPLAPRGRWRLGVVNLVAVLVLYFAVPVNTGQTPLRLAAGLALTLAGAAVVVLILSRELGRHLKGRQPGITLLRLVLLVEVVQVAFALVYFNLAVNLDGQMVGIQTRLDALYFTATTMTTTGFGDVHAAGQLARGVTTVHLVVDVLFVALLARIASTLIGRP